jgi:hypothetical protein
MKKILMLAFLLLISIEPSLCKERWVQPPAAAQAPQPTPSEVKPSEVKPSEDGMKTMTMDGLGCKSREDADKILHMVVAQDDEAFRQFQILHLPTRDCRWFKKRPTAIRRGNRLCSRSRRFSGSSCAISPGRARSLISEVNSGIEFASRCGPTRRRFESLLRAITVRHAVRIPTLTMKKMDATSTTIEGGVTNRSN